jgi:hypothetical protein
MGLFSKGGYDSPENKKRRETKKSVEKKEKEEKQQKMEERARKRAKERGTMLAKDVKSIKDIAKGGKDFLKELHQGAKNVSQDIKRVWSPTPAQEKEDEKRKTQYMERVREQQKKKWSKIQKNVKAQKAGAPDSKGKYVYDAVRREAQKKIKPSHLTSTTDPKKVANTMTDQVDAMKKQAAKRGAKEEGIGSFKVGGIVHDRNYLKGR